MTWKPWMLDEPHTVVGNVQIYEDLYSPQLGNTRHIYACLPPSYTSTNSGSYPVVYMHDGQNLFDQATSFTGEWQVDETVLLLSQEGLEFIVIGIPNAGDDRIVEYTPHIHPDLGGGNADDYLDFVVNTVKPLVINSFRVDPSPGQTAIIGSSLGGLISLYALFSYPDVFRRAGVMSPAFWVTQGTIFDFVENADYVDARIYMDIGGVESQDSKAFSRQYMEEADRMVALLKEKGYSDEHLLYIVDEAAIHHEKEWARRLPGALRFLMAGIR
jgi:predicted alpha/beta superfamily hydrolase